jgi:hypothetical protein
MMRKFLLYSHICMIWQTLFTIIIIGTFDQYQHFSACICQYVAAHTQTGTFSKMFVREIHRFSHNFSKFPTPTAKHHILCSSSCMTFAGLCDRDRSQYPGAVYVFFPQLDFPRSDSSAVRYISCLLVVFTNTTFNYYFLSEMLSF